MKKYNKFFVACLPLFITSCLFSSDDIKDYHVVGNFYISSFAEKNTLLYKSSTDLKLIGSGNVILENVDSVGWYKSNILAVFNNQYFFIDTASRKIEKKYDSYNEIIKSIQDIDLRPFNLRRIIKKAVE